MTNESNRVLVVAAHPDDEVLGCGATMARLAGEGADVVTAILGEGITSREGIAGEELKEALRTLKEQARGAAEILGVRDVRLFDLPDNRFDSVDMLDIVKMVEGLIAEIKPAAVFTHHRGDLNIDHQITNMAVLTATRPVGGHGVREIYSFEVPSSTEWAFGAPEQFKPDTFYSVGETMGAKIDAMAAYASEARDFPHPRSPEALKARAAHWGAVSGLGHAEAFMTLRRLL